MLRVKDISESTVSKESSKFVIYCFNFLYLTISGDMNGFDIKLTKDKDSATRFNTIDEAKSVAENLSTIFGKAKPEKED